MNCPRCGELIDEHEAGRETDACVSEVVLGWKVKVEKSGAQKRYWVRHPTTGTWAVPLHPYSISNREAMRLIAWKPYTYIDMEMLIRHDNPGEYYWSVILNNDDGEADTLALALCRAALRDAAEGKESVDA